MGTQKSCGRCIVGKISVELSWMTWRRGGNCTWWVAGINSLCTELRLTLFVLNCFWEDFMCVSKYISYINFNITQVIEFTTKEDLRKGSQAFEISAMSTADLTMLGARVISRCHIDLVLCIMLLFQNIHNSSHVRMSYGVFVRSSVI